MSSTASAFSSSETAPLERETELEETHVTLEQIWNANQRKVCSGWIKQNGYKRVCLQFPDDYLTQSNAINDSLKSLLTTDVKIFILADTSYGSCCVDEVAAAHVQADCLIHFGNACRSKVSRLPVLYMFPQFEIGLPELFKNIEKLQSCCVDNEVCIYLDIGYHHLLEHNVDEADEAYLNNKIKEILSCKALYIEAYPPADDAKIEYEPNDDRICIFIGADNSRFFNVSLTTKASKWFIYDANTGTIEDKNPLTAKFIRRRYYFIEKCKDAKTLGLIVATLTTDGYLDVIVHLQEMAKNHGIKTQIISVGRINPAKLANFLEIDCFVLIGCPYNNMYNSKDFYKPIVSVFEAEMALNPAWHMKYPESYVTDFKQILPEGSQFLVFDKNKIEKHDVSLVSGRMRYVEENAEEKTDNVSTLSVQEQALVAPKMAIMETNTGLTFEDRTWKGLDPALGCTEPAELQQGLSGIPINYTHN